MVNQHIKNETYNNNPPDQNWTQAETNMVITAIVLAIFGFTVFMGLVIKYIL